MSVRLSLLALATLALSACDGRLPSAPAQQAACCCKQCPADAAPPVAKAPAQTTETGRAASSGGERVTTTRVGAGPRVRRESRSWRYESSDEGLDGGRYGARSGMSVSVSETESSSERYSYSETSSVYGSGSSSGGGYGYGSGGGYRDGRRGPGPGDGRVSRDPPHHPGYRLAGIDEDGYLTWPGKVED